MSPRPVTSLARLHPLRVHVPLGLLVTLVALSVGFALPVMRVQKLVFWNDDYTVITGVFALWRGGDVLVGSIIFAFCVVFPVTKLVAMLYVWFVPTRTRTLRGVIVLTRVLGKWSMLDVFVVAVFIVLATTKVLGHVTPRVGLYVLAGAVLATMVLTVEVDRLARRHLPAARKRT